MTAGALSKASHSTAIAHPAGTRVLSTVNLKGTDLHVCVLYVCMCVCVRVRACVRACVRA